MTVVMRPPMVSHLWIWVESCLFQQAAIGPECVKTYVEVHHIQLASWASRRNALTNIIIVEFSAFDELEAMTGIKAIRSAFFESTNSNRERSRIRLFENLSENSRAYS